MSTSPGIPLHDLTLRDHTDRSFKVVDLRHGEAHAFLANVPGCVQKEPRTHGLTKHRCVDVEIDQGQTGPERVCLAERRTEVADRQ